MANFWDLPRPVRDKIYRLHLVDKENLTSSKLSMLCRKSDREQKHRSVPPLLQVSPRADREAAPIFFGENQFEASEMRFGWMAFELWPRHLRLIRKVTCEWDPHAPYASPRLDVLRRFKGLCELTMKVDEHEMVQQAVWSRDRKIRKRYGGLNGEVFTAQEQLALFRFPGISNLLLFSGLQSVNFVKRKKANGEEYGGPIPEGFLLTRVLPKITAAPTSEPAASGKRGSKTKARKKSSTSKPKPAQFDFLALPAELRNCVYDLLLHVDGPVHPSKRPPSSSYKRLKNSPQREAPDSALSILTVSKQIYNEAVGIFYHKTPFVFFYPTQLPVFTMSLSIERLGSIGDITLHYDIHTLGGVSFAELAFLALKPLKRLRRLHIIMHHELYEKMRRGRWGGYYWDLENANPGLMPGMATLFELRGITGILIRDILLEEKHKKLVNETQYPEFPGDAEKQCTVRLDKVLKHFNAALQDAQKGKVNEMLLEDNQWQLMDDFPVLEVEEESEEVEEPTEIVEADNDTGVQGEELMENTSETALPEQTSQGPRRSARIAAKSADKADGFGGGQHDGEEIDEHEDNEDAEEDDVGEEIVLAYGRGASPEL